MLRKQLVLILTFCLCALHTLSLAPDCSAKTREVESVSVTDDVYSPNDYPEQATQISVGQEVYGTISTTMDIDFYRFDVKETTLLSIQLTSKIADLDLTLFDQDLVYVAEATDVSSEDSITTYLSPGTYFVRLYAPEKAKDAVYRLKLDKADNLNLEDNNEPNDEVEDATILEVNGETVIGAVYSTKDIDWFEFQAQKAGIYNLDLATNEALYVRVFKDDGQLVFEGLISTSLPIRLGTAGVYDVCLEGSGLSASYEFSIYYTDFNDVDSYESNDANEGYSDVQLTGENLTIFTNLDCVNDADNFKLQVEQPFSLTLAANGPRDLWVEIYKIKKNEQLKLIYECNAIVGGNPSQASEYKISDLILTKGNYMVKVGGIVSSLDYSTQPDYRLEFTPTKDNTPGEPQKSYTINISCSGTSDWSKAEVRIGGDGFSLVLPAEPNDQGQLNLDNVGDILNLNKLANLKAKLVMPGYYADWEPIEFDENGIANLLIQLIPGDLELDDNNPGINQKDLELLASYLGEINTLVDYNDDGVINIFDLVLVSKHCHRFN